jgi:Undecaprenyl-phosphate galactose phosphotransferase WbaP
LIKKTPKIFDTKLDWPSPSTGIDVERMSVIAEHTAMRPNHRLRAEFVRQSIVTGLPLLVSDLLIATASMLIACQVVNYQQGHVFNPGIWNQLPAFIFMQWLFFSFHQLYPGAGISPPNEIRGVFRSTAFSLTVLSTLNMMLGYLPRIEFAIFVLAGCIVCILAPLSRIYIRRILSEITNWGFRVLLVGSRSDCVAAMQELVRRRDCGYKPVGFVCPQSDIDLCDESAAFMLDVHTNALKVGVRENAPVIGFASSHRKLNNTDRLVVQFPGVIWVESLTSDNPSVDTSGLPEIITHGRSMPFLQFVPRLVKRATDLALALPLLLLLSPLFAVIALAIKCISPGPVFYASKRIGQYGRPFRMWKFRTMVSDADNVLRQHLLNDSVVAEEWRREQKLKNDPRVIPRIGAIMRRMSIDELPQLWNVVVGEMSLVGPRPLPEDEVVLYESRYYEYTQMWPGITGLWQVSGRNDTSFDTRIHLVHHYATHWSIWLDIWILIKTPAAVFTKRGAY